MTTIAHLTDIHLGPVTGLAMRYWNVKRALGFANWLRHRAEAHDPAALARLCEDLALQRPDHVLVTGDLTNLGLPSEHARAATWLSRLGAPDKVSVIPGNHDIYSRIGKDEGTARWRPFMASDETSQALAPRAWGFPYVRRLGAIAIVGLNSAHETPPFVAAGALGRTQLERLEAVLDALGREKLFRLVMIHHPPLPGQAPPMRALKDAAGMQEVIARAGAELVIHGHNHRVSLKRVESSAGPVPVVGGASASLGIAYKGETLGRYNIYEIGEPPSWRVEVTARGFLSPGGDIGVVDRFTLTA